MSRFFLNRLIRRKLFFLSVGIGTLFSILYAVWEVMLAGDLHRETVYTKWIEALSHSEVQTLFFMIMPILSAMAMADLYLSDKKSGYLTILFTKTDPRSYFKSLYLFNFAAGGLCMLIPLMVNLYLCFLVCPNRAPDLIVDGTSAIQYYGNDTLFPALYFNKPFLHVCIYLFLGFLAAGIFASLALALSFFVRSKFLVWVGPYVINYIYISIALAITGNGNFALMSICVQQGSRVTLTLVICMFSIWLLAVTALYGIGVKKRASLL